MHYLLPLFPLQLVVFPGEKLNLHIFEPRYKQLIKECQEEGKIFGIPPVIEGEVMTFGTEIELLRIEKTYPNGELDIRTRGKGLFKIDQLHTYPEKLYYGAKVQAINHDAAANLLKSELIIEKVTELFGLLAIPRNPPELTTGFSTFDIAHHIGLSMQQEYEFLQIEAELERQDYVIAHLKELIPRAKFMSSIRERALLNGHFRNIIPPEI